VPTFLDRFRLATSRSQQGAKVFIRSTKHCELCSKPHRHTKGVLHRRTNPCRTIKLREREIGRCAIVDVKSPLHKRPGRSSIVSSHEPSAHPWE